MLVLHRSHHCCEFLMAAATPCLEGSALQHASPSESASFHRPSVPLTLHSLGPGGLSRQGSCLGLSTLCLGLSTPTTLPLPQPLLRAPWSISTKAESCASLWKLQTRYRWSLSFACCHRGHRRHTCPVCVPARLVHCLLDWTTACRTQV